MHIHQDSLVQKTILIKYTIRNWCRSWKIIC